MIQQISKKGTHIFSEKHSLKMACSESRRATQLLSRRALSVPRLKNYFGRRGDFQEIQYTRTCSELNALSEKLRTDFIGFTLLEFKIFQVWVTLCQFSRELRRNRKILLMQKEKVEFLQYYSKFLLILKKNMIFWQASEKSRVWRAS